MDDTGMLLRRAASGEDPAAWKKLVEQHTNILWSVARSHRLSSADAADAVQTTWLRLLENIDRIEDPDRVVGWLVTTVRRECLRIIKLTGREPASEVEDLDRPDPDSAPDADLLVRERNRALWAALEKMSVRCQELIRALLLTSPSPSYEMVSASLRIPIGSIGPTRQRCLGRLRNFYEPPGPPDGDFSEDTR